MNKFHKFVMFLTIAFAAGLTVAVAMIKGMPDGIEWEDDDNE